MIRQKLSAIKEHRDNEVEFLYGELKNRHQSEKTAVIILTVLFTQMCDAESSEGDDAAVQNPNRAVCSVLAHLLMNPKIRSFTEKLIKAFKHRRYDNEGNKIVLPITDYMEVKSPLELMDEEAKVKVERWVEEIEKLTRGIRGFLNIDWTAYDTIWRNICAEQEISLLLNEIQPRKNSWGHTFGGYENRTVTLQQVPISWISFVIKDTKLAEAVKLLPDYDISIPYSFASSDEETGEASKMGKIIYSDSKVPVTLNYGGKQHLVFFNFKCPSQFVFDADKRPISPGRIQLELKSIIVDNVIVQEIDGYSGEEFFLSILGKTDSISK